MILYSQKGCPMCNVLKAKLKAKNISFKCDEDSVQRLVSLGFHSLPVLETEDGKMMSYREAFQFLESYQ